MLFLFRLLAGHLPHLPSSCVLCATVNEAVICSSCQKEFLSHPISRCCQCANPWVGTDFCQTCYHHPPAFDQSIAAVNYVPPIDQLVHILKFKAKLALAPVFAHLLYDALLKQSVHQTLPALLIAIPLSAQRLVERGFNQALEIAKPLSQHLDIPLYKKGVIRTKDTLSQTQFRLKHRQRNLRNAFEIPLAMRAVIKNQHVGVVDDVMTTGTTLNEVAKTLKKAGAATVTNLVFARTPPHLS